MTVNSFKKPVSTSKMDMFISSSDLSTSSPSSIYDDRLQYSSFCENSALSNINMDSDDIYGLDDNMENGLLETFLTPDVMNSINQSTTISSSSQSSWAGKLTHDVSMPSVSDSLSPNPTLTQVDMEPDMTFVNDIINVDLDESKLNCSVMDLLSTDINLLINQPSFTNASCNSPGSTVIFHSSFADSKRNSDMPKSSEETGEQKSIIDMASENTKSYFLPNRSPSNAPKPQLIGVATVFKPELKESCTDTIDNLNKLKAQTPSLHKMLSTDNAVTEIKTEVTTKDNCDEEYDIKCSNDIPAQIVPSSGTTKRSYADTVKKESMLSLKNKAMSPTYEASEETMEEKWKDIEHFLHSPGEQPQKKARHESVSSGLLSDDDEDDDDDDDNSSLCGDRAAYVDSDDDYSDIDADLAHISPSECESLVSSGKKQKQYFWQYNVQSKGPKGTRLKLSVESPLDPHVLNDFEDPVFDECNTAIAGIRHGGKARKGDGNEISPNPRKLFMIGHQLLRLNHQINACQLGNDVPAAKRNESRKEKNKLASRACRLKKKAQHEANKIKLYGLEQEHSQLNSVLQYIWPHISEKSKTLLGQTNKTISTNLTSLLESQVKNKLHCLVAGHTTEYVNNIIIKVESGDNSGGLNIKRSHKT